MCALNQSTMYPALWEKPPSAISRETRGARALVGYHVQCCPVDTQPCVHTCILSGGTRIWLCPTVLAFTARGLETGMFIFSFSSSLCVPGAHSFHLVTLFSSGSAGSQAGIFSLVIIILKFYLLYSAAVRMLQAFGLHLILVF